MNIRRSVQDTFDHADELAKRFEDYEPEADDERDPQVFALRDAVASRSATERSIKAAVNRPRDHGYSWGFIGSLLGTSGEAARQRYANEQGAARSQGTEAARRRAQAARGFKPAAVKLLLVAEAPPSALDRYFYFEDVREQDSLFRYVARALLGVEPTRDNKGALLAGLRDEDVFLIDLSAEPLDDKPLAPLVPDLVIRATALTPRKVILIKATVYDVAFAALRGAGLPVVDERIPFPGSGQQKRFEAAFARALAR